MILHPKTIRSIKLQGIDESESRRYRKPVYRCGCFETVDIGRWNCCEYHNGYDDAVLGLAPPEVTT
jgi:hypothetical protein